MMETPLAEDLALVIQPVVDEWMGSDHGGVVYTKELTDLIIEALTLGHPVALYNAGYKAGYRAGSTYGAEAP
jgi:hypothetical protein